MPISQPLAPGQSQVIMNGVTVNNTTQLTSGGQALLVQGEDFAFRLSPTDASGKPLFFEADGAITVSPDSIVSTTAAGFCASCAVHVYWHAAPHASATGRAADAGVLLVAAETSVLGLFAHDIAIPSTVPLGPGVMQVVGGTPGGETLVINVAMEISGIDTNPSEPSITLEARRGTGRHQTAITVRGVAVGISMEQVTIRVRIGRGPRTLPERVTTTLAADGTFTTVIRSKAAARVVVEAGGVLSNVVNVSAVRPSR